MGSDPKLFLLQWSSTNCRSKAALPGAPRAPQGRDGSSLPSSSEAQGKSVGTFIHSESFLGASLVVQDLPVPVPVFGTWR